LTFILGTDAVSAWRLGEPGHQGLSASEP
jgi:hypothetical protein